MKTIYLTAENLASWQQQAKPTVIALGCFDGLHHGHVKVIQTALQKAQERQLSLSVMSFYPHPKTVLGGKKSFNYLMPEAEKIARIEKLGVDTFFQVEFTKEFAALPPEEFVTNYLLKLGVVHAVAGFDFSYGCYGAGNMNRLFNDSNGRIAVTTVEKLAYRGEKVSSTSVRKRLLAGKVEELPHFLGYFYEVKGNWDGQQMIPSPHYMLPAAGRYAVTLFKQNVSMDTEVIVTENHLICEQNLPLQWQGSTTVRWNRRVEEKKDAKANRDMLVY